MSFAWSDFLALACKLANKPDEASRRSAISRAYYAVFCTARDWVESYLGVSAKDEARDQGTGVHKYVWETLGSVKKGSHADLSDIGKGIMRNRARSDYDNEVEKLNKLSSIEVVRASHLLDSLEALDGTK